MQPAVHVPAQAEVQRQLAGGYHLIGNKHVDGLTGGVRSCRDTLSGRGGLPEHHVRKAVSKAIRDGRVICDSLRQTCKVVEVVTENSARILVELTIGGILAAELHDVLTMHP